LHSGEEFPLIFYHFHKTEIYKIFGKIKTKSYRLLNKNKNLQQFVYQPYTKALSLSATQIKAADNNFRFNFGKMSTYIFETIKESVPAWIKGF
jgi:hypothetical protein